MSIEELIRQQAFYHYYQPIIDFKSWKRIGNEVLLRSKMFAYPEDAFDVAKEENKLFELDTYSIEQAIRSHQRTSYNCKRFLLFINVYPSTIQNPDFLPFIEKILSDPSIHHKIVLEINEAEKIDNYSTFKEALETLRAIGILIAMDDLGMGHLELQNIIELKPDFIKLDKYFASGIEGSPEKQRIVELVQSYCSQFNISLILEGIETPVSLATAKSIGIHLGQGFATGRPELLDD
ncbi:EAL domain-containing protein [Radiobacillus sp. PE A8.2]|uniref:EAL domain-containing protein n=1 Tax=Radiobacillus sp. PE A8.2 TaxID=3380349 RepID=UPI003890B3A2